MKKITYFYAFLFAMLIGGGWTNYVWGAKGGAKITIETPNNGYVYANKSQPNSLASYKNTSVSGGVTRNSSEGGVMVDYWVGAFALHKYKFVEWGNLSIPDGGNATIVEDVHNLKYTTTLLNFHQRHFQVKTHTTDNKNIEYKISATFAVANKANVYVLKESGRGSVDVKVVYFALNDKNKIGVQEVDCPSIDAASNETIYSKLSETDDIYEGDCVVLTAKPEAGYQFYGWYQVNSDGTRTLLTDEEKCTAYISSTETKFYAAFNVKTENLNLDENDKFLVGISPCQTFEQALAAAVSLGENTILQLQDYTVPAGNYTIPSGVTLLIPKDANQKMPMPNMERISTAEHATNAYRTLTLEEGTHLDVYGTIEIGGTQSAGVIGAGGEEGIGFPTGTFGCLQMNAGSSVTLNNGARLYAWGYVLGELNAEGKYLCEIDARRGSIIHEQFQLMDWKGGTYTLGMFDGNNSNINSPTSHKVLPVNQYYIQNVEVPVKYRPGAKLFAAGSVYLSLHGTNLMFNIDNAGIIGAKYANSQDAAIFLMNDEDDSEDTWVRKYYDVINDKQVYEANNSAYLGSLVMSINGQLDVDSREYKLPITNNFKIHLLYGNMEVTQHTELLAGAEIEVNKKSTLMIPEGVNMYMYDKEDWGRYISATRNENSTFTFGSGTTVKWRPGGRPTVRRDAVTDTVIISDAKLNIHGTLELEGNLLTTQHGASITSTIADAGTVVFLNNAPANSTVSQITSLPADGSHDSAYKRITCTSAQLTNGNASFTQTTEATAGQSFCYIDFDGDGKGEWKSLTVVDDIFVKDESNVYYIKPGAYVPIKEGSKPEEQADHTYHDEYKNSGRMFILATGNQWWEVTQVRDNLFKCEHPDNTTYYYFDELDEGWLEKKFKVTWLNWDGKPIKYYSALAGDSVNYYYVTYNTVPDWKGSTPTHADDDSHTYSFSGWLPAPAPVTEDVTYVAQFAERDRMYAITFNDANNELIQLVYCKLGEVPVCSKHELAANEQWSPAVGAVAGNQTYTLAAKNNDGPFTITFVNWDGTELQSASVAKDEAVAYTGATPTKEDDDLHSYNFTGWTPAVVTPATADATYTATYTTAPRSNDIVLDANGSQNLNDVATLKDNLIITSDGSSSGQLLGASKLTLKGDAVFKLATTIPARTWYAVAAPWKVDVRTGIYANGNRLTVGRDFDIIEFDAEAYASGDSGEKNRNIWKYVEENGGVMVPGKLYMVYLASEKSSLEFHRTTGSTIFTTTISLSTTGGNGDRANWNAIANPALYHANLGISVIEDNSNDVLQYTNGGYTPATASNMIVGKPIFVQVNSSQSIVIAAVAGSAGMPAYRRAPQTATDNRFVVEITRDGQMNDRIIVQTAEEKADEYVIGKDLAKMGVGTKAAQMWMERYDTKLCKNTLEMKGEQVDYPLSLFAPAAGEYILTAAQERGEATLYLTRNGQPVWNLSYGEYVLNLEKGTTTEYGLRLVSKVPQITTGIGNVQTDDVQCTKVLRDGVIYILRGNNVYTIDGQLVK